MFKMILEGVVFAASLATIFLVFFVIAASNDAMWESLVQ